MTPKINPKIRSHYIPFYFYKTHSIPFCIDLGTKTFPDIHTLSNLPNDQYTLLTKISTASHTELPTLLDQLPLADLTTTSFPFLHANSIFIALMNKKKINSALTLSYNKFHCEHEALIKEYFNLKSHKEEPGTLKATLERVKQFGNVVTRFPPEPSGYLHLGHAKAALLNQYFATQCNGTLRLRFDDTNPLKEDQNYVDCILEDLKLLHIEEYILSYTSDYFSRLLLYAECLIRDGKAYCDNTDVDTMREERNKGVESRYRNTSINENIEVWRMMVEGTDRSCLRAKIDMASKNKAMCDPVIYRFVDCEHHRTGTKYKIYPTYDFVCPIVDTIEEVTCCLRTNEYRDRNEQYKWFLDNIATEKEIENILYQNEKDNCKNDNSINTYVSVNTENIKSCESKDRTPKSNKDDDVAKERSTKLDDKTKPEIFDFSKLTFENTILSKRRLKNLVETENIGWDDPRMPTLRGIKRLGLRFDALKKYILSQGMNDKITKTSWDKIWAVNKKEVEQTSAKYFAIEKCNAREMIITNYEDLVEYVKETKADKMSNDKENKLKERKDESLQRKNLTNNKNEEDTKKTETENKHQNDLSSNLASLSIDKKTETEEQTLISYNNRPVLDISFKALRNPKAPQLGYKTVPLSNSILIAKEDYSDSEEITLMNLGNFIIRDNTLKFVRDGDFKKTKIKTQWVCKDNYTFNVFEYGSLFLNDEFNKDSKVIKEYVGENAIKECQLGDVVQFERDGFFYCDSDGFNLVPYTRFIEEMDDVMARLLPARVEGLTCSE